MIPDYKIRIYEPNYLIVAEEEGHWHINEGSGTLVSDSSSFGRDGTYEDLLNPSNPPSWVSGKLSNALYFESSKVGSVNCGDITDFDLDTPFSIEFWFWLDSTKEVGDWAGVFPFISKYENGPSFKGWNVFLADGTIIDILLCSDSATNNEIYVRYDAGAGFPPWYMDSNWHHLVMTYDGSGDASGVKLYIDNVLRSLAVVQNNLTSSILNTEPLRFGCHSTTDYLFYTKLDEIVLYSGALSVYEIGLRWNGGEGTEESLSSCNLIFDTEDENNPNREEVISISASRTVSGETPEAEVVFDNDPKKDFTEGDIIEIEFGWKSPLTTRKVFSGIIYEATENSDDEDKTITLRAKDWSFLLLTDKVTLSYPVAVLVSTIVEDIISSKVVASPVPTCILKISDDGIEADISTRQLDFVGEAMIDALNKVDDVCDHDWYVNEEKDFQFFLRFSRPTVPKILTAEDLENYSVADPFDNLCNKIDFYGNSHKLLPYDGKAWTQTLDGWDDALGGILDIYTDPESGEKFVEEVDAPACQIYLDITAVDSEVDLTVKGAYKTLSFIMWMAADTTGYAPGVRLSLLAPDYAHRFEYPMWDTFNPVQYNQLYQIPVGPDNEESAHWKRVAPPGENPDWSTIRGIMWEKTSANATTLRIGALRFADGKYFGTSEDIDSQNKYGLKYRELFDETVFSNKAAQRRAEKLVSKFKDPIGVVSDVVLEFTVDPSEPAPWNTHGQEYLEPGDKIIFDDSITEFAGLTLEQRTYRIETITHKISEELEYTCELVVSLDPVMFEGQVASISERARRLEQKYTRLPAAEPIEVD